MSNDWTLQYIHLRDGSLPFQFINPLEGWIEIFIPNMLLSFWFIGRTIVDEQAPEIKGMGMGWIFYSVLYWELHLIHEIGVAAGF